MCESLRTEFVMTGCGVSSNIVHGKGRVESNECQQGNHVTLTFPFVPLDTIKQIIKQLRR